MKNRSKPVLDIQQGGFTLVSLLLALIVVSLIMTAAAPMIKETFRQPLVQGAVSHLNQVRDAAQRYVKDNHAALAAAAPVNGASIEIPFSSIRNTGYLPSSVRDLNPFGHSYAVRARRVSINGRETLEVLVVGVGGAPMEDKELRRAAGGVRSGGFISELDPSVARNQGGWSVPVASFGVNPGFGHLASALFFDSAGAIADYLYRNAVPGRPDVNRMNTSIDMNSQNVNNAGTVSTNTLTSTSVYAANNVSTESMSTGNIWARDGVMAQNVSASGTVASTYSNSTVLNTTNANVTSDIVTGGSLILGNAQHYGGWTMIDNVWIRSVADRNIYTGGTVQSGQMVSSGITSYGNIGANGSISAGGSVSAGGDVLASGSVVANNRLYANEFIQLGGVGSEGGGCGPNGVIGRTPDGALLSCTSGVWSKNSGNKFFPEEGAAPCSYSNGGSGGVFNSGSVFSDGEGGVSPYPKHCARSYLCINGRVVQLSLADMVCGGGTG